MNTMIKQLTFDDLLREKELDGLVPGFGAPFDPAEAEAAGACVDDALEEQDAIEASLELPFSEG